MPRDVLTIEEDDDSMPESGGSSDEGGPAALASVDSGATVNFMNEPTRRKTQLRQKVVRKKKLTKREESSKRKKAAERMVAGLVRPDVTTDKEKERALRKIATRGVVQLFNAVAERQRTMSKELSKKLSVKERKESQQRMRDNKFDVSGMKEEEEEGDEEMELKEEEPEEED